jgi:uncharacterized protein YijF (DUF1287 family)
LQACDKKDKPAEAVDTGEITISQQADNVKKEEGVVGGRDEVPFLPMPPAEPVIPPTFFEQLSRAALERTTYTIVYDGRYVKIAYPMGDVSPYIGVCTDVVVRSYRQLGIDLQQLVHEDMKRAFKQYPSRKLWGLRKTDTNIDHRRVPNLRAYFERHGESLIVTDKAENYRAGDLVTWSLAPRKPHIGIVAEQFSMTDPQRRLMIHNIGSGPVLEDMLFRFKITGHYRYQPEGFDDE